MGFFDNLGKAISDVGQKGKDIASAAKYNRMIGDEERDITKIFEQLGKKYFELHADDFEPDFEDMVTGIKDAQERIQNYKDIIDTLQGIIRCVNCGADVPEGASFCPECGAKIIIEKKEEEKQPDPNKFYCDECGEEVKPSMKFCIHCGAEVKIPEASDMEEAAFEVKEEVQEAAETVEDIVEDVKEKVEDIIEDIPADKDAE